MTRPALEQQILQTLLAQWGYVIGSAGLRQALGFTSQSALRRSIRSHQLPFQVFTIAGRKGRFALTHEVAIWLASRADPTATEDAATARSRGPPESTTKL